MTTLPTQAVEHPIAGEAEGTMGSAKAVRATAEPCGADTTAADRGGNSAFV